MATAPAPQRKGTMIYWLAQALKTLRHQQPQLKQVRVAAAAGVDQSTIWRLEEEAFRWPKQIDVIVAAYAEELELDPREIWAFAIDLWRNYGEVPTVAELTGRVAAATRSTSPIEDARAAFERALTAGAQAPAAAPRRKRGTSLATATRTATARAANG